LSADPNAEVNDTIVGVAPFVKTTDLGGLEVAVASWRRNRLGVAMEEEVVAVVIVLHHTLPSDTGFVEMSAGAAYEKSADPGCVPAGLRKARHVMVFMSTSSEGERISRPQICARFRRTGAAVLRSMLNCEVGMEGSRQGVVVKVTVEAEVIAMRAALVRVKDFIKGYDVRMSKVERKDVILVMMED
jgi:hypothetical protein